MAEAGCLRDLAVRNLTIVKNLSINNINTDITGVTGPIVDPAATAATTTQTGTATFIQPANTVIRNIFLRNAGAVAVAATVAQTFGMALQVGTTGVAAGLSDIFGPAAASVAVGNIITATTAAQTWPPNVVAHMLTDGIGAAAVAAPNPGFPGGVTHPHGTSTLSNLQQPASYTLNQRQIVATITTVAAAPGLASSPAATWNLVIEFTRA
jgi:hypothetical protein